MCSDSGRWYACSQPSWKGNSNCLVLTNFWPLSDSPPYRQLPPLLSLPLWCSPSIYFSFFSFNDLPQFVPICDVVWKITCARQPKSVWGVGATVFGVWQCVCAHTCEAPWASLCSALCVCFCVCVCVCVCVCMCVCVVERWGTEEVGVWLEQLSLGEYRDTFIRHDIRGSELLHLERRDLKVRTHPVTTPQGICVNPLVQPTIYSFSLSLMLFNLSDVSLFCHLLRCAALLCLASTVWLLLGERDLL